MFYTVKQVRQANKAIGQHFFDRGTMRFFASRVGRRVYRGCYFISSERREYDEPRRYTIRRVAEDGRVYTVGNFQAYKSARAARRAIEQLPEE